MNVYILLQLYLNRLDDYKFTNVWEKRFMGNLFNVIAIIFVIFVLLIIGVGVLFNSIGGFLLALLMMGIFFFVLGYFLFAHFMLFLAKNNQRYLAIKMNQDSNTINYDNVVN